MARPDDDDQYVKHNHFIRQVSFCDSCFVCAEMFLVPVIVSHNGML